MIITDCGGGAPSSEWEKAIVHDYLFYIVPLVTVIVLWKLFVTNRVTPPGNVIVLGLDANDSPSAPSSKER